MRAQIYKTQEKQGEIDDIGVLSVARGTVSAAQDNGDNDCD
jgi:hypothetical protein